MLRSEKTKARLFITYLKDKVELFLYVKPRNTVGAQYVYRRSPGDAALRLRFAAMLENARVLPSEMEIWVLLYPPEIRTSTFYASSERTNSDIRELIQERLIVNLPYFMNYDLDRVAFRRYRNGDGKDMVTVTLLGKSILYRIKDLLYKDFTKVTFIGDGLQFLALDYNSKPYLRGKTYECILPYDETCYKAIFRAGIHFESIAHPKLSTVVGGPTCFKPEQVYLKLNYLETSLDLPLIQPLISQQEWQRANLTAAAFPLWYIASQTMEFDKPVNFADSLQSSQDVKEGLFSSWHPGQYQHPN